MPGGDAATGAKAPLLGAPAAVAAVTAQRNSPRAGVSRKSRRDLPAEPMKCMPTCKIGWMTFDDAADGSSTWSDVITCFSIRAPAKRPRGTCHRPQASPVRRGTPPRR